MAGILEFLVGVVIVALVIGFLYWVSSLFPLPAPVRTAVNVLFAFVGLVLLIWLLSGFVGWTRFPRWN